MKRPSIWPLLVIVMVIGNVFALMVFQDRLQTSELLMDNLEQTIRQQSNHTQSVERDLQEAREEMAALQAQLDQTTALGNTQAQAIEALSQEIKTVDQAVKDQANTTSLPENDDIGGVMNWTFTLMALVIAVLELVLIGQ